MSRSGAIEDRGAYAGDTVCVSESSKYAKSLSDLERETRVDPEDMVEEQAVSGPRVYVDPADLDRQRLLSPTGDGRLTPG
jgi:hypothetical protein